MRSALPQPPDSWRTPRHTQSLNAFEGLDAVLSTRSRLSSRKDPLVQELTKVPGTKQARWTHLLDHSMPEFSATTQQPETRSSSPSRLDELEERVKSLEDFVDRLTSQLGI